jgi:F-type H+-transporting ATPase subunit a
LSNDPIHQFHVNNNVDQPLFGLPPGWGIGDVAFNDAALFMVAGVGLTSAFMLWAMRPAALVPGRAQSVAESAYGFIHGMVKDAAGEEGVKRFFPFVFTLFLFIFAANMLGMFPYFFTPTSQIVITATMALMVFFTVIVVGFAKNGFKFFKLFVPSGVPWWLMPIIIPIELISYLIRPISHSVRLFANMMAGHTMLKVFAGFVVGLGALGGWAPMVFLVAFTGLEVVVAFLQALIFTVLTCIYLNDALHMHH